MSQEEIEQYQKGSTTSLLGYTSTSKTFKIALQFALVDCQVDRIPVVFQIKFKGNSGLFNLSDQFSAYPEEEEVLVQDGLTYRVKDNTEKLDSDTNLKY